MFTTAAKIVAENLSYNTNYSIEIKKPSIVTSILPTLVIKADELNITQKTTKESLNTINPEVKLRLLPLLSGHLHINNISASEINITTSIVKKPQLDSKFFEKLKKTKVRCDAVKIDKIGAKLYNQEENNTINYRANELKYKINGRYIKIDTESELTVNEKASLIKIHLFLPKDNNVHRSKIDLEIKDVDIEPIALFFKNFLPKDFVEARGEIDISVSKNHMTGLFENCCVIMQDSAKSMIFPEKLNVGSDFHLTRKTINIERANINSENIHTNVSGTISNYLDMPLPSVNLDVRIDKSKIEDFISLLPAFKTEDIDMYKLKKYKFYGNIIGNLSIKGDNLEPAINGNIYIDNGILTKPIPNAKGAIVKLKFIGKYLNFDVTVPAGGTEKVWVKGGVELYNVKYSDMRVWSTQKVDLATAEEKVVPIHEILNFVIGPVPIMNIKGDGNIDITIKGNRKNPHVWGSLNFNNVETFFNDIPNLKLKKAITTLNFDDENAVFRLKQGEINDKPVNIDGTCTLTGKFDFDVSSNNQDVAYLYNAIATSTGLIDDFRNMLPKFDIKSGLINLKLKVYGNIKEIENAKFGENFFTKGKFELLGNTFGLNGAKIHDTKGLLNFDGTSFDIQTTAQIGKSPLSAKVTVKSDNADVDVNIPKLNLNDIFCSKNTLHRDFGNIITAVSLKYKGSIQNIDLDKVELLANILGAEKNNKLQISNGTITMNRGKLNIRDLKGIFLDTKSSFDINLSLSNPTQKPDIDGDIKLKDFELRLINLIAEHPAIPEQYKDIINRIRFDKGKINLNATIRNNNINTSTNLGGVHFTYTPLNLPVQIVNGSIYAKRNFVGINKINILADEMPILIDGNINDIFSKQDFNLYINSKPQQDFIDKYINNNRVYPLKIKGDIVYQAKIKGTKDDFNISGSAKLEKNSSIYYLGAMISDVENALMLNLNANIIKQNLLKIREFSYDKLVSSQGTKQTKMNMVKAWGGIELINNDVNLRDLRIKTQNPTDARIFNIIFHKPNIKQGQFTSDLRFNGKLSDPQITGVFHIFETNIPFLDITMKNIALNFKDKYIYISSQGEVLGNEINFKGTLRNKLSKPYYIENAELFTNEIDLNYIADKLKSLQVDNYQSTETNFNLNDFIIKNIALSSNSIRLRNIVAQNVNANASISDNKVLKINNFKFDIANGNLNGNFTYNLRNNNTGLNLKARNIDANELSYAVFDLKNHMYGDLTGDMELSCNGTNFNKCMETLYGRTKFNISNGRIPKLGSLEYLLRASNLIKSGITSLSINGVIDIITPLKTGEFSDIYGSLTIKNGISNDIEIATKGKDLSLFISGTYNFATANAEMEVLGLLSKKISTMFGPLGNMSLNTLFSVIPGVDLTKDSKILNKINRIPGIELSEKLYRKFIAEIKGNINGEDYVTSFRWIN